MTPKEYDPTLVQGARRRMQTQYIHDRSAALEFYKTSWRAVRREELPPIIEDGGRRWICTGVKACRTGALLRLHEVGEVQVLNLKDARGEG